MTTELNVIDANVPIDLGVADDIIAGLKGRLTGLSADTHHGYQQVKAGIAEVRTLRTGVERSRKELKQSALDWGRKVDAEARRLTDLILEVETPLRAEKSRIDDEAHRKRKLLVEAQERADREVKEALEAQERAKREEEQKRRDEEDARLKAEREALAEERHRLNEEQGELRTQREAIEAEKRNVEEEARQQREAKKEKARKAQEVADRAIAAEAEKVRLAQEKAEAERLAEQRKPDREKLLEFSKIIAATDRPIVQSAWGHARLAEAEKHLTTAAEILEKT